jgi:hypothetical protein
VDDAAGVHALGDVAGPGRAYVFKISTTVMLVGLTVVGVSLLLAVMLLPCIMGCTGEDRMTRCCIQSGDRSGKRLGAAYIAVA